MERGDRIVAGDVVAVILIAVLCEGLQITSRRDKLLDDRGHRARREGVLVKTIGPGG